MCVYLLMCTCTHTHMYNDGSVWVTVVTIDPVRSRFNSKHLQKGFAEQNKMFVRVTEEGQAASRK